MDVYKIHTDGTEELLAAGLSAAEVAELREWFSYTKPLGHSFTIVARQSSDVLFSLACSGSEPESGSDLRCPPRAA